MNTIYLIIKGYYSDWQIIGYATSEQEAQKIKESIIKMHEDDLYSSYTCDEIYIKQIHKINETHLLFKLEEAEYISFKCKKNNKEWQVIYNGNDFGLFFGSEFTLPSVQDGINKDGNREITINTPLHEDEDWFDDMVQERCKKVAQDALYEYLYRCDDDMG